MMRISARKLSNGTIQVAHGDVGYEIVFAEFKLNEPVGGIRVATAWQSATVLPDKPVQSIHEAIDIDGLWNPSKIYFD